MPPLFFPLLSLARPTISLQDAARQRAAFEEEVQLIRSKLDVERRVCGP